MELSGIQRFLDETIERGYHWRATHIIGGESTTHPRSLEVVEMLREFRNRHIPALRVRVTSTGRSMAAPTPPTADA
jgi:hypothetical protein